jgi:hypothetical protein
MKKITTLLVVFIIAVMTVRPIDAQQETHYQDPGNINSRSFFFLLGYTQGPYFNDYVNWANQYYRDNFWSSDSMSDFEGGLSFSAGFRSRFSRHFAFEFDFAFHSMKTKKAFYNNITGVLIGAQDLRMNVAIFTGSVPLIFEFYDQQPLVPFIAAGVSIFSIRLDHTIMWGERHIKTALAGNFAVGCEIKITRKFCTPIRVDWTLGKIKMPVTQIQGQPNSFNLNLNVTQIQVGILYDFQ